RLRVEGASLAAADLLTAGSLLRTSRITRESLRGRASPVVTAVLAREVEQLFVNRAIEDAIEKAIDDDGQVRDDASSTLKKIRRELKRSQGELVKVLARAIAELQRHERVAGVSVAVRRGRVLMRVAGEDQAALGGVAHPAS